MGQSTCTNERHDIMQRPVGVLHYASCIMLLYLPYRHTQFYKYLVKTGIKIIRLAYHAVNGQFNTPIIFKYAQFKNSVSP